MHFFLLRPQVFKCNWKFLGPKEGQATQRLSCRATVVTKPGEMMSWQTENWCTAGWMHQRAPASGCVCTSSCVGLQTGTTGAEDPAHGAEGVWLRISSALIPQTNCALISQVYLPVQFHIIIKSQFIQGGSSQCEPKGTVRGSIQKCPAGLNSLSWIYE